jgi:hypothetical protein
MGPDHEAEKVILSRRECLARLASTQVGHIGVSIDALPVIFPVHFTLADESILFRTTLGTKLDSAASSAVVAFQVDEYDAAEQGWWSVLLQGIASPIAEQAAEIGPGGSASSSDWSSAGETSRLLRVDSHTMTGRLYRGAAYEPRAGVNSVATTDDNDVRVGLDGDAHTTEVVAREHEPEGGRV